MKIEKVFLEIAKSELQTIREYSDMLESADGATEEDIAVIHEILSDEFNHSLIASLTAANIMGVSIATDDLSEDPNDIKVE